MKIFVAAFAEGAFEDLYECTSMEEACGFTRGYSAAGGDYGAGHAEAFVCEDGWAAEAIEQGLDWDEVERAQTAWEKER